MTDIYAEITRALELGQSGVSGVELNLTPVGGALPSTVLLNVAMERHRSVAWVVSLFPFSMAPVGGVQSMNVALQPLLRARVQWGNGKASDECLVDYPRAGCSFAVSGAFVRVSVEFPTPPIAFLPGQTQPRVGGMVAGAAQRDGVTRPVWLTTPFQALDVTEPSPVNGASFEVPPRARGFRVIMWNPHVESEAFETLTPCIAEQFDTVWTTLSREFVSGGITLGGGMAESMPTSRAQVIPLHPATSVVLVYPSVVLAEGAYRVAIQWEMDLA